MKESYYRKTATIVGALFIIATVTALAAGPFGLMPSMVPIIS